MSKLDKLTVDVEFLEGSFPELINKIKAEAVRDAINKCGSQWSSDIGDLVVFEGRLRDYANKLEKGE